MNSLARLVKSGALILIFSLTACIGDEESIISNRTGVAEENSITPISTAMPFVTPTPSEVSTPIITFTPVSTITLTSSPVGAPESTATLNGLLLKFSAPTTGEQLPIGSDISVDISVSDITNIDNMRLYLNGVFVRQENISPYTWNASDQDDSQLQNLAKGEYKLETIATLMDGSEISVAQAFVITDELVDAETEAVSCVNPILATNSHGSENILDNNLTTYWSNEGLSDTSLVLDCGGRANVSGLQIAFLNGDRQSAIFQIEGSNDGIQWTVLTDLFESSGNSLELQYFEFNNLSEYRYVRYVGYGTSQTNWNAITEFHLIDAGNEPASTSGGDIDEEFYRLGAQLYADNCSLCHKTLAESDKKNSSAAQISASIISVSLMQFITLSDDELNAVEYALSHAPESSSTTSGLEYPTDNGDIDPSAEHGIPERLVRLSGVQYNNTLASSITADISIADDKLPFVRTGSLSRFSTDAKLFSVTDQDFELSWNMAETFAERIAKEVLADRSSCIAQGENNDTCLSSIVKLYGEKIFRRPLSNEEVDDYVALAKEDDMHESDINESILTTTLAMMVSPNAMFRTELGDENAPITSNGGVELSPYEMASLLSYALIDSPPDNSLLQSAKDGSLLDEDVIQSHVRRLLAAPATSTTVQNFLKEYFDYSVLEAQKDTTEKPGFDFNKMVADTDYLIQETLETHAENNLFRQLMLTTSLYDSDTGSLVENNDRRVGILSQPSWLVRNSRDDENYVIGRGLFVRESLMCGKVPEQDIQAVPALPIDPHSTLRERMEITSADACWQCHSYMNPLGFPFEQYDHWGDFRLTELGEPVVTTGFVGGTSDQDGASKDHVALINQLGSSETTNACFVSHSYQYWLGADDRVGIESEQLQSILLADEESNGSYIEILAALFSSKMATIRVPGGE